MAFGDILAGFAEAGHKHRQTLLQLDYEKKKALAEQYGKLAESPDYPEESRREFLNRALQIHALAPEKKLPKEWENMQITVQPRPGKEINQNVGQPFGLFPELSPFKESFKNIPAPIPPAEKRSVLEPMSFDEKLRRLEETEEVKGGVQRRLAAAKAGMPKVLPPMVVEDSEGQRHRMQVIQRGKMDPVTGEPMMDEFGNPQMEFVTETMPEPIGGFAIRRDEPIPFSAAIQLRDRGRKFFDEGRNPIDLDKYKDVPGIGLVPTGNPDEYAFGAIKYRPSSIAGQMRGIPEAGELSQETMPQLGQATATLPRTRNQPFILPTETGGRGVINFPVTTTTQVPGTEVLGQLPKTAPAPTPPPNVPRGTGPSEEQINFLMQQPANRGRTREQIIAALSAAPPSPSLQAAATGATAPAAPPPTAPTGTPQLQEIPGAMNPGEYRRQADIVTRIKPSLNMLLGDPENPAFRGLESFAHLADDPRSRARVGNAARLILKEMADTGNGGGGLGASLFGSGINIGGGSLIKALENKFGLTEWKASTSGKVVDEAMTALTAEERQFLDRIFGSYGTVVGLRAVTGGSALQFNAKLMEFELPVPGLSGLATRRQYYDKLASLTGEPLSSTKTFSDKIFVDRPYYLQTVRRLTALGNGEPVRRGRNGLPDIVFRNGQWVPLQ